MTDKEYREQKKRVRASLEKFRTRLGFDWYELEYFWHRDRLEHDENVPASCLTLWEYRRATLNFYLPSLAEETDEELDKIVLHELCHILLGSIEDYSTKEARARTEYATETVAMTLRHALG